MCQTFENIKLCTCHITAIEKLPHYWVLKRESKNKIPIVGELMAPPEITNAIDKLNSKIVEKLLNTSNCFDFDYKPTIGDVLELFFATTTNAEQKIEHIYVFKKNGWKLKKDWLFLFDYNTLFEGEIKM